MGQPLSEAMNALLVAGGGGGGGGVVVVCVCVCACACGREQVSQV